MVAAVLDGIKVEGALVTIREPQYYYISKLLGNHSSLLEGVRHEHKCIYAVDLHHPKEICDSGYWP